jgi:hypothetical protein
MYRIKPYSKEQALKLGVKIKPSTNYNKKIDVFKNGIKIATIGDINYKDYPTYLLENKELDTRLYSFPPYLYRYESYVSIYVSLIIHWSTYIDLFDYLCCYWNSAQWEIC